MAKERPNKALGVVNCGVGHHMAEVVAQYGMGPIMLFMKVWMLRIY